MKRLIVCCDGTWNTPDQSCPSNVKKIAKMLIHSTDSNAPKTSDDVVQYVKYAAGVGTKGGLNKWFGGAFGWGLDDNIKEGYQFLVENYELGDEVYLFGFSRGAYTVRSLAGMIYCSGLLPREHISSIDEAYKLYRNRPAAPSSKIAEDFREKYNSPQIEITLVGCWDTVGAMGLPQIIPWLPINDLVNRKYRFYDTQVNRKIRYALHAIAIDEKRRAFDVNHMDRSDQAATQIKEVWFPGAHGAVGGGTESTLGLSNATLKWMIDELKNFGLGLQFDQPNIDQDIKTDPLVPFDNSLGAYRFTGEIDREVTGTFADLHPSVKKRWKEMLPKYNLNENFKKAFQKELDA